MTPGEDPFAVMARSEGAASPDDPFSVVETSPAKSLNVAAAPSLASKSHNGSGSIAELSSDSEEEEDEPKPQLAKSTDLKPSPDSAKKAQEFDAKFPSLDDFEGKFSKEHAKEVKSPVSTVTASPEKTKTKSPFDDFDSEFSKIEPVAPTVVTNDADFDGPLKDFFQNHAVPSSVSPDPFVDPFSTSKSNNPSFNASFDDPFATASPSSPLAKEMKPEEFDSIFGGGGTAAPTLSTDAPVKSEDLFGDPFGASSQGPPPYTDPPTTTAADLSFFADSFSPASEARNDVSTSAGIPRRESVQHVIAMGFTDVQAREALDRYEHDITKAINFLLDGGGGGESTKANGVESADDGKGSTSKKWWNPLRKPNK
jgi:hypothetical protein